MNADTLIIIPAYNEEKSIKDVVCAIKKLHPDIVLLVIDDGSSDNTAGLAAQAGAQVLSHPFNLGYGAALQTGYKYALYNNYEYIVQLDGDGQHEPQGIRVLLENLKDGSCDIVLGSRFLGAHTYKSSISRMLGSRFFRSALYLLSRQDISDPTTGFQAMNSKVLGVFIQDLFPCDYPDADIIILLSKLNFRIKEVALAMYPSPAGKSMHHGPAKALYYIFKMLLSMFLTKLRRY